VRAKLCVRSCVSFGPTGKNWRQSAMPIARAPLCGFRSASFRSFGGYHSSFLSYAVRRRFQQPEEFGHGEVAGVGGGGCRLTRSLTGALRAAAGRGHSDRHGDGRADAALMIHGVPPGPSGQRSSRTCSGLRSLDVCRP